MLLPAVRDDLEISNTVAGSLGTVNVGAYLFGTLVVAGATSRYRLLDVMRIAVAVLLATVVFIGHSGLRSQLRSRRGAWWCWSSCLAGSGPRFSHRSFWV